MAIQAPSDGRGLSNSSLGELEAIIERGLETFVDVGLALLAIRDRRLYRESHAAFDDYCRERWGFSRIRAHQLIEGAEVAGLLTTVNTPPATERQARELVPLLREDEQQMVEVWRELKEKHGERVTADKVRDAVSRRLQHDTTKALVSSETNEWYTPLHYIVAAKLVMGGIDLDPASHAVANETVGATQFYDIEANGLQKDWHGRVWLNPPWGQFTGDFVTKLVDELEVGQVFEAICLVNAHATDTNWFQPLWDGTLCFTDHRIDFSRSEDLGRATSSTHGSVFVYFGPRREKFIEVFGQFGPVVERAD